MSRHALTRRLLLGATASLLLPYARARAVTHACLDSDEPTPRQTAGPYFTPNSPERRSLIEQGMPGKRILLTGRVIDRDCKPVAHALLDLWHADSTGAYDNDGYRLRGHQFSDAEGRYQFETIVPGIYPGRTRHFHIKVQAPKGRVLTTQLYFPGEPQNQSDGIFDERLLLDMKPGAGRAKFDFVV